MSFIKKIQKKPRSTRLLILWLASFLVMIIIIIIWLLSFSQKFSLNEEIEKENKTGDLPSLFKSIGKDFSLFRQGLEARIKNIKFNEDAE